MQVHGSCAAKNGAGVLLLGPPGSGKSDLLFRLIGLGFSLVADDRVDIVEGVARPPSNIAGLLNVRGFGIVRLPFVESRLALIVELSPLHEPLPSPCKHSHLRLPLVTVDPVAPSAAERVRLALDCVQGRITQVAGALSV
jgi:HPr kinase/phosphorylase